MRRLVWLLVLLPGFALAQDRVVLNGDEIQAALQDKTLTYQDGATQKFMADGGTLYHGDSDSRGHWRVQGGQYCSNWPPSDRWTCYGIEQRDDGIGFVAADGSVALGHYAQP